MTEMNSNDYIYTKRYSVNKQHTNKMHGLFKNLTFVVIDVETTGVSRFDRICEIGMTKITHNRIFDKFETLINPGTMITNTIFHGIEDWMVEDAPPFRDVAKHIARFMSGAVLIAHNAPFDMRFMRYELQRMDTDLSHFALCTLKLAKSLHPEFPYHRLDYLLQRYGIINEWPHRAGTDADSEAKLFLEMKQILLSNGLKDLGSLQTRGLSYNHHWCKKTDIKRSSNLKVLTRDDLM